MTDEELMRALFAEGLPPHVIAEKFEVAVVTVNRVLGLTDSDPRIVRTYQRFWRLMGEQVMTSPEIAKMLNQCSGYANSYLHKLEERGQIKRVGTKARRVVMWQMVRIDDWLPDLGAAA